MKTDILMKRADYINKNNEILQEFYFSHPRTKINSIYNSNLSGSCLWDLFCKEAIMMENTWNVSMRLMLDIPRESQWYLIEPLGRMKPIKQIILDQIKRSNKSASKLLFLSIRHDIRSTTGSNLWKILLQTDKDCISDLVPNEAFQIKYDPINGWFLPEVRPLFPQKKIVELSKYCT